MELLNLKPNTDQWLLARIEHFCASEAPVVMNESKFMTRNQLLDLKKGWQANPEDNSFKQRLFQRGHEHEDLARTHVEFDLMVDIPAAVGSTKIRGIKTALLASFDGLNESIKKVWEHKDWNNALAENARNEVLEPHYYWQLEHQCIVSGLDEVQFTVSDGSYEKRVNMIYKSQPARQKALKAAWKQFEADLIDHTLTAKDSVEVEPETMTLPAVTASASNGQITTNIQAAIEEYRAIAKDEMARTLETDQDFANKDSMNKLIVIARNKLKEKVDLIKSEFVSFNDFSIAAAELDGILQKLQSSGEKAVKDAKERKKNGAIDAGKIEVERFKNAFYDSIRPLNPAMIQFKTPSPDWPALVKNKRTLDSITSEIDGAVAAFKAALSEEAEVILPNFDWISEAGAKHKFLFHDLERFINQPAESFQAICKQRISEFDQAERERLAAVVPVQEVAPVQEPVIKAAPAVQELGTATLAPEVSYASKAKVTEVYVLQKDETAPATIVITLDNGKEFKAVIKMGEGSYSAMAALDRLARELQNRAE